LRSGDGGYGHAALTGRPPACGSFPGIDSNIIAGLIGSAIGLFAAWAGAAWTTRQARLVLQRQFMIEVGGGRGGGSGLLGLGVAGGVARPTI
jgi:hypothetical protein